MSKFDDIEEVLRDSRLPDRDESIEMRAMWREILTERKTQKHSTFFGGIKPWVWGLASLIIILSSIFLMICMARPG